MDDEPQQQAERNLLFWTPRRAVAATLVACGVAGSLILVYRFRHVVIFLLLAIVLATALKPIVEWLSRRGIRSTLAVATPFVTIFLAALALVSTFGPRLAREGSEFWTTAPQRYEHWRERIAASPHSITSQLAQALPDELPLQLPGKGELNPSEHRDHRADAAGHGIGQLIFQVIMSMAVVCILSSYWLLQEQRTIQSLLLAVPRQRRDEVKGLIEAIDTKVGAYVRGQLLVCLSVGVMSLTGYWFIGLPQALFLALVAGALEAVPLLGPILGAVPALAVALSTDPSKALAVIVVTIGIQQVESYLLIPRIMDRAVGLNGFVTLFAIAAFGALFGLLGAILAIPLAAIVQLLVNRYVLSKTVLEPSQPDGRDRSSRLRFELQSLVKDVRMVVRNKAQTVENGNDTLEEAIETIARDFDQMLACDVGERLTQEEVPCALSTS